MLRKLTIFGFLAILWDSVKYSNISAVPLTVERNILIQTLTSLAKDEMNFETFYFDKVLCVAQIIIMINLNVGIPA